MARIKDKDWVKNSFLLPSYAVNEIQKNPAIYTSASTKFNDTTLGGNQAINPPPQFTRFADPKQRGKWASSRGMGRKYSEMIDDNAQLIHMRFGTPQFNSLITYFTQFYDWRASVIAREGRAPGFFYNLGRAIGFVVTVPVLPLIFIGRVYRFLANKPTSKYYFLKPTMATYWSAANAIANGIAVNMGMVPRVLAGHDFDGETETDERTRDEIDSFNAGDFIEEEDVWDEDTLSRYREAFPDDDVFDEKGGIDLFTVALRGQRLADRARRQYTAAMENADTFDSIRANANAYLRESVSDQQVYDSLNQYLEKWSNSELGRPLSEDEEDSGSRENFEEDNQGLLSSFVEFAESSLRHGAEFVTFRVNHTGSVSESFSNQTGQSQIAQKINATSSQARSKRFTFADGNVGDGPLGSLLGGIMSSAGDLLGGIADSLNISGLAALAGNAFADVPEVWKDSQANLPEKSYSIELRSPYGNKMSRFINLVVPLSLLLAAALPKSHGKQSYGAPFLVEIYDRGRAQTRLGIIDSLTIERGVGNIGWTDTHEPLGINVSFTVKDLSSVLHMPINPSPGIFDDQSAYTDYLATLGSLSLSEQVYPLRRMQINMTRAMTRYRTHWTSPARYAMWSAGTTPGRMLSALVRNTGNPPASQ